MGKVFLMTRQAFSVEQAVKEAAESGREDFKGKLMLSFLATPLQDEMNY